jgi:SAM-dependent methyltransferase
MTTPHAFYTSLATWWPLISPVEDYAEEAEFAASLLRTAAIPVVEVLELGSGGGHNACFLRKHFHMTLVDLSEDMLAVSRALNPDCEHHRGDMRSVRLGRTFDAVFIHDAIEYMTTPEELGAALKTAATHCKPGGVVVILPDATTETLELGTECGGTDAADGRGARYLEWTWDPDASDTWVQTEYSFVFRHPDGTIRTAHETHRTGVFPESVWMTLMSGAGLVPQRVTEQTTEERTPRTVFVGRRT